MRNNIILADCEHTEISAFAVGLQKSSGMEFGIASNTRDKSAGTKIKKIKTCMSYFTYPLRYFIKRKRYDMIVGWQQFYALNFAFYCRLFSVKKRNRVIVCNFTYKQKNGIVGKIYRKYFNYIMKSKHIDAYHVLSKEYAREMATEFNIPIDRFIVTQFGTPDRYEEWHSLENPVDYEYVLSIGRSNRDFDFLAEVWRDERLSGYKLLVLSDTWKPTSALPDNVVHIKNVTGDRSFSYFSHALASIVPIASGNICSGDTVLLNSMMMKVPVIITEPSTLAEMYISDGVNGICVNKDAHKAAEIISSALENKQEIARLGDNARKSYLEHYTRESMGAAIGNHLHM